MANTKPRGGGFQKKKFGGSSKTQKAASDKAASGYAHRHSLKAKQAEKSNRDVYEYMEEKTRRGGVRLELDYDEAMEFGDLDDSQRDNLRARLIGEHEDDEQVASDDDEEIDSDAAFEEEDEERFAEFFPNKKKKAAKKDKGVRFAEVDLNEDDEPVAQDRDEDEESVDSEEEGEDDEFIDLLDVLDGKGEVDMPSDDEKALPQSTPQVGSDEDVEMGGDDEDGEGSEEEGSEEEEGDDDDEEEFTGITVSDDEEAEGDLDNLQNFVSGLSTSAKRKAEDTDAEPQQKRKRRMIQERTETGAEDEFRVNASESKLNLDDFLAPLSGQSSSLLSLKKTTKLLGSSSKLKAKTLSAPLPQRAQEKLDREAAYEQTKAEVDKWNNTMKRIREAEHLSFPLQAERPGRVSNLELTAKFKPTTALESAVDNLLKSAKVREEDIAETEEGMLKANNLSVEEVAERRAELRKMRELMYRAEVKAKRVKKIKSKTYRKIQRKAKERLADQIDEDNSDAEDEDGRMKREYERAVERATLRHKHTGKWARAMQGKHMDVDQRKEIEEMLDKGDKLRRRIQGHQSGSESDDGQSDESGEDDEDEEATVQRIKSGAFDELQQLKSAKAQGVEEPAGTKASKSLMGMKFMREAMAAKEQAVNREADDFIKEMAGVDSDVEDGAPEEASSGVVVERVGGRTIYRPGAAATSSSTLTSSISRAAPPSDTSSITLRSSDALSPIARSPEISTNAAAFGASSSSNPWLAASANALSDSTRITRKANEIVVAKDSKAAEKSKNRLKKEQRKREEERRAVKEDAQVDIEMDNVLQLQQPTDASKPKKGKSKSTAAASSVAAREDDNSDDEGANSEVEAQEQALLSKKKGKGPATTAFQQRDLVALAFAGDNVVREFEESKRREIAYDAPKEVDTTLPGWGAWGGTGLKKAPPKPHLVKTLPGIDPATRADYNKKHIIISEKRDKKAAKYMVTDLPYPYTSQKQYERAMERPLGAQWNTRTAFQRATLPRVVKKPGVVITPLKKAL